MFEVLKFFLEKLDFLAIVEYLRKRGNRRTAARLHLILIQSYEIIELYEVLLDELQAALDSHKKISNRHCFYLDPHRLSYLLGRQSSNVAIMETLTYDLLEEIRLFDNKFSEIYRAIIPGKAGILFEAHSLLSSGRLPLAETQPSTFPASKDGVYRTIWFTSEPVSENRRELEKYLHGYDGRDKTIVDVSIHDGDIFFNVLEEYFQKEKPTERLQDIKKITDTYREALLKNFTTEDILSDISAVRKHYGHLP